MVELFKPNHFISEAQRMTRPEGISPHLVIGFHSRPFWVKAGIREVDVGLFAATSNAINKLVIFINGDESVYGGTSSSNSKFPPNSHIFGESAEPLGCLKCSVIVCLQCVL